MSDQEIHDLREQMRGNLLLSLENSSSHMWRMVQQEMYLQQQPSLRQTLDHIGRLTQGDLRNAARDLFLKGPLALSAVGPVNAGRIPTLSLVNRKKPKTAKKSINRCKDSSEVRQARKRPKTGKLDSWKD